MYKSAHLVLLCLSYPFFFPSASAAVGVCKLRFCALLSILTHSTTRAQLRQSPLNRSCCQRVSLRHCNRTCTATVQCCVAVCFIRRTTTTAVDSTLVVPLLLRLSPLLLLNICLSVRRVAAAEITIHFCSRLFAAESTHLRTRVPLESLLLLSRSLCHTRLSPSHSRSSGIFSIYTECIVCPLTHSPLPVLLRCLHSHSSVSVESQQQQ